MGANPYLQAALSPIGMGLHERCVDADRVGVYEAGAAGRSAFAARSA
jgi:hypothetical protein